jgi:hypothetical protein
MNLHTDQLFYSDDRDTDELTNRSVHTVKVEEINL